MVSLAVGVVVTVLAAVLPALRAARVPPVAAINDLPTRTHTGFARRAVAGLAVLVVGIGVLVYGLARAANVTGLIDQVQVVALGAFAVLVGVVMLLPVVARPVVGVIGAPLRRFGPPRCAGARERDAQPASHRGHRVRAGDRARARRSHRDVRRVGEGVGRRATPAPGCARTTS